MQKKKTVYAIEHQYIALPEGVMPWGPTYSPDGEFILFHDYNGGKEWMLRQDGTGLRCITGKMKGRPDFLGGFYYLLDEQRMFLSNELGDTAVILECQPAVYDWESYRFVPVDLSADVVLGRYPLGRRTYHMAPDGKHLAYNILTSVGLVMVLCTLRRKENCYKAEEFYCLNPRGPASAEDPNVSRWCNGGTLAEFKAFCDGGRSFLFVSEGDGGNIDQYKCSFETGEITRLSFDADWDEDGALSPDGKHTLCASWRTMKQLDVLSQVPGIQSFHSFYLGAVIAVHYVSSFPGFVRDLQPWLDSQPLSVCKGENILTVNNIAGHPMWSPDSTRVLLQERCLDAPPQDANDRVLEKGMAPNRIHVAKLRKTSTTPLPTLETKVGKWAVPLKEYSANGDYPGEHVLYGSVSGRIKLTVEGNLMHCNHRAEYENYSNDGVHFLQGKDWVFGNVSDLHWIQNINVQDKVGNRVGETDFNLHFEKKSPAPPRNVPPMVLTGTAKSTWQGETRCGLPGFGGGLAMLPTTAPLHLSFESEAKSLVIHVSALIEGELHPVCGASITVEGQTHTTGETGEVRIPIAHGRIHVEAEAGDNFIPASMDIYM